MADGTIVAAAEEERFTRRKHGKPCVPFSTWELPEHAARWCLGHAGLSPSDLDAVAYSYDPTLASSANGDVTLDGWEPLRTLYAARAPQFLATALPGLQPDCVRFVPHHVAHAASAAHAGPSRARRDNRRGRPIRCRVTCSPLLSPTNEVQGAIVLMEEVSDPD